MTNTSCDISGKLDAEILEIIELLISVCAASGVEALLAGAVARDIHFLHVHGIPTDRATVDVDFAIRVHSWDAFNEVMGELTRVGTYTRDKKLGHRLHTPSGHMFDLLPFGEIEEPEGEVRWAPDFDHVMSTTVFKDAFDSAQVYRVNADPPIEIRVVSIPGMAVLKLIAWADGYPERSEAAIDFRFILENYDAGQMDRLFSKEEELDEIVSSEFELAVAQLLGRDAGRMMTAETTRIVLDILDEELRGDGQLRLVSDMLTDSVQGADFVMAQIKHFRQGILDASE